MAFNVSNPNAKPKQQQIPYQQQYRQPPPGPPGPPPQQQYGQQKRVSQQYMQRQMSGGVNIDEKDEEAMKLAKEKQKTVLKNCNVHFNFFDESQYGIVNFPKTLSEIGVLSSKVKKKGLIVGCGSGRMVFEMAKHFLSMDGIDINCDFISAANAFKSKQMIEWSIPNHGDIIDKYKSSAFKDLKCDKAILSKCNFSIIKDYHTIPLSYNKYDCIIILNVLCKLHSPKKFVNSIQRRVNKGGTLIFSECFDWNEKITQKNKWIGGTGNKTSSDALKEMLRTFTMIKEDKMSFIERKNAFSFKLSIANTIILKKK